MHARHPFHRAPAAPRRSPALRLAPALAAACLAASLVGCSGASSAEDPTTSAEESAGTAAETTTAETTTEETDTEETDAEETTEPAESADEGSDAPSSGEDEESADDGAAEEESPDEGTGEDTAAAGSENLFEGSWGFGHDSKAVSAEDLADLLETEAEARGPEEMFLEVVCDDGFDLGAGDWGASCTAIGDEGYESPWSITANPADSGAEVIVQNTD